MVAANNPYTIDFSPVSNALARWQQQNQFERQAGMQDRQFAEGQRQFNASNALAQQHFGLAQQAADRADDKAPYELKQIEANIAHLQSMNASEAQLRPHRIAYEIAKTQLAEAQAKGALAKNPEQEAMGQVWSTIADRLKQSQPPMGQPPQQQYNPGIRPQSFDGGQQPMQPQTNALAPAPPSYDPGIIPTAGPSGQPAQGQPQAQEQMIDVPGVGMVPKSTAEAMRFVMAKDRGAVVGEAINADKLSKEARNEVDKNEIKSTESLARIDRIASRFDPKFLTLAEQAKQLGMSWQAWLGAELPPEQAAERGRFVRFKQDTVDNLNRHIQAITGAAMGVEEAKRIMSTMPNMSMDGYEFEAAMKNVRQATATAVARSRHLRNKGFTGKPWEAGVELGDMAGIIDERSDQIEQQARQRGVPPERIRDFTKQTLKREFGI